MQNLKPHQQALDSLTYVYRRNNLQCFAIDKLLN